MKYPDGPSRYSVCGILGCPEHAVPHRPVCSAHELCYRTELDLKLAWSYVEFISSRNRALVLALQMERAR
jgi:hypothetical protein